MSLWKWLGIETGESAENLAETDSVRKIMQALASVEPERARFLAAFAYLLGRVAHADLEVTGQERAAMAKVLAAQGGLTESDAHLVADMASNQASLFGATEDFLVGREFQRIATREEKVQLLDCLFAVSAAQDLISAEEDNAIRQISRELLLDSLDYLAVRMRYKDRLTLMQGLPGQEEE